MILILFLITLPCILGSIPEIAGIDVNAWWGPEERRGNEDTSIEQFEIKFEKEVIDDLLYRLKNRRKMMPPLKDSGFSYGFNTDQLDGWLNYWADEYPFSERERYFNKYPHYKTTIQGLKIHFMRVTPKVPPGVEIIPVLMLHGWPGSFLEFYEAIPHLTAVSKDRNFALEIIAPSLPGFGFSEATHLQGLGSGEMAVIFKNLMQRLGYEKFVVQGGDWGSTTLGYLSALFPENVMLFHTNYPYSVYSIMDTLYAFGHVNSTWNPNIKITKNLLDIIDVTGYYHEQATRPDSLGVGFTDSPAGLLAYLLEKYSWATNFDYRYREDGGLLDEFTAVQLIDILMIYWINGCITSSMRIYAESNNMKRRFKLEKVPVKVPVWILQSPHEIIRMPLEELKHKYHDIRNATYLDKGGHFLAYTYPKEVSDNVIKAITEYRQTECNPQI